MRNFRERFMGFFLGFFVVVVVNLADIGLKLNLSKNTKIIMYVILILFVYLTSSLISKYKK